MAEKPCIAYCCGLGCGRDELSEVLAGDGDADPMLGGVVGIGERLGVLALGLGAEDAGRKPSIATTLGGGGVREGARARGMNSAVLGLRRE